MSYKKINRQSAQEYIDRRLPIAIKQRETALVGWLTVAAIMLDDEKINWYYDEEKDELKYKPKREYGRR